MSENNVSPRYYAQNNWKLCYTFRKVEIMHKIMLQNLSKL